MPMNFSCRRWVWVAAALAGLAAGWMAAAARSPAPAPGRWVFRDDLGQRVVLPGPPRRVACSGRDLCDLARALLGEEAVIVLPAGAEEQHLRESGAGLVVLPAVTRQPGLAGRLRALGWPAATLRWRDVDQLPAAARRLAGWLNQPGRGQELATAYRRRLDRVAAAVAGVPEAERPVVVVLAWDQPPVWAQPGSPVATLVRRAGGRLPAEGRPGERAWGTGIASWWHRPGSRWGGLARLIVPAGAGAGWQAGEEGWRALGRPGPVRVVTPLWTPVVPPGGPAVGTALYLPPAQLLGAGPAALEGLERLAAWLYPERLAFEGDPHRLVPLRVAP
ncbi:ABC transporter substrate-binding protein [Thermaerobacter sp. PB12/4term]|nr:ABC transporter substrate-binding protein [Thermaerobacter sp. PB12/4term]